MIKPKLCWYLLLVLFVWAIVTRLIGDSEEHTSPPMTRHYAVELALEAIDREYKDAYNKPKCHVPFDNWATYNDGYWTIRLSCLSRLGYSTRTYSVNAHTGQVVRIDNTQPEQ